MGAKKQKWSIGDLFAIRRKDGRYIAGQVIGREPEVLNSVSVALFDEVRDQLEQVASVSLRGLLRRTTAVRIHGAIRRYATQRRCRYSTEYSPFRRKDSRGVTSRKTGSWGVGVSRSSSRTPVKLPPSARSTRVS